MKKAMLFIAVLGVTFTACKKEGCIDATATNYDAKADKDDGSCQYSTVVIDTSSNTTTPDTTTTTTPDTTTTGGGTTVKEKYIPAKHLDTLTWTNTWLMPYSDTTIGFDFSKNEYNSANRDGYLNMSTHSYENASEFNGQNKVKNLGVLNLNTEYKIPTTWDAKNDSLVEGNFYAVQCKDGYARFKVKYYMTCCGEYEIDFKFVATANIEEK